MTFERVDKRAALRGGKEAAEAGPEELNIRQRSGETIGYGKDCIRIFGLTRRLGDD